MGARGAEIHEDDQERQRTRPQSPPQTVRLAVVYATDFEQVSPGGIASGLKVLARYLGDRFRLVLAGVGEVGNFLPTLKVLEGREITVIPIVSSRWKPKWLPLNILFVARLLMARRTIMAGADLINPRRMESAIPFIVRKRKPVVLTIHGASSHHRMVTDGLLRWKLVRIVYDLVERFVLARVDKVILVSEEGLRYYLSRYPWLRDKATVVPNSVDLTIFSPIERSMARSLYGLHEPDLTVVYCGRLSSEKRIEVLLEAFSQLVPAHPSAVLLIAGEGPAMEGLRTRAATLGLHGVRFLGMLDRDQVRVLLSAADVFVLPSMFEGFPNVILEALSCGVPVVAADVGDVREILVDDLQRLILHRVDPLTIMDKILEGAEMRPGITHLCIQRARHFDATRVVPLLERVYSDVAASSI